MCDKELWYGVSSETDNYLMSRENLAIREWKYKYPLWEKRNVNKKWIIHIKKYLTGVPDQCNDYAIFEYLTWCTNLGGDRDYYDEMSGQVH